jgi:hypothetical protein
MEFDIAAVVGKQVGQGHHIFTCIFVISTTCYRENFIHGPKKLHEICLPSKSTDICLFEDDSVM